MRPTLTVGRTEWKVFGNVRQTFSENPSDLSLYAPYLTVFCVSSLDYQKTTLPEEDEPEVYDKAVDTEIPSLHEFVQSLGESTL